MTARVDHGVTSGTFSLDGQTFDVDNNVWVIGDDTECIVLDARDIAAGPVARIVLPHPISSGTHACWADASEIRSDAAGFPT